MDRRKCDRGCSDSSYKAYQYIHCNILGAYTGTQQVEHGSDAVISEAPDGVVIRAVAKEAEKDETSDVAMYVVDKNPKAHITEISWYSEDKTQYEYEFYIDSMKSDSGIVVVAIYDEGHVMTGIGFSGFECANGEAIASGTVTTTSDGSWCKVFVINSMSGLKPLSDVLVRDTLS